MNLSAKSKLFKFLNLIFIQLPLTTISVTLSLFMIICIIRN